MVREKMLFGTRSADKTGCAAVRQDLPGAPRLAASQKLMRLLV